MKPRGAKDSEPVSRKVGEEKKKPLQDKIEVGSTLTNRAIGGLKMRSENWGPKKVGRRGGTRAPLDRHDQSAAAEHGGCI